MCQQYYEVRNKLKEKLKTYSDKMKLFCKTSLNALPFLDNLKDEIIEEIAYHLKQRYYKQDEVIYRVGDPVENIYFVSRGEIELIYKFKEHDFVLHYLFQGWYMGGYHILNDHYQNHTARTLSDTTLQCLSKESLKILTNTIPEFKSRIDEAILYFQNTDDPIVSFGMFRDMNGSLSLKEIFKMAVAKIINIYRDFKEAKINNNISEILDHSHIKSENLNLVPKSNNIENDMMYIAKNILLNLHSLDIKVRNLEENKRNKVKVYKIGW